MAEIDIYTWADIDALCARLAASIHEPFDVVVCVLRGGAVPGVILANALGIDLVLGIKVEQRGQLTGAGQGGGAYRAEKAAVVVPLNGVDLRGRRVLVVDDVLDSGESVRLVVDTIVEAGAAVAKVATLQVKAYSPMRPDYYVEERTNWLFYPWMSGRELQEMEARLETARSR
ncbi:MULTISPECIES: phosphoribosyltransferase [Kitasatospora]|uniref:Phosphoribosyltransferase family protein n=1 Tax=Kitasatospora cathayae TaxID=3004092 RepID=A0ABY7QAN4_9ACTN|nr:phosphoribosyltransferase family protein [Kitasatospora sp. HUAS 3-15]WBP89181.1 phosphoribosyltransferase family protein [Kitasatospora sp. HUAS 3-15]